MSDPARRDLEKRIAELRESGDGDRPGFLRVKIGGDPESERTGYYEFDPDPECYVNEHGHTISADAAPDSESDCTVKIVGDEEADR